MRKRNDRSWRMIHILNNSFFSVWFQIRYEGQVSMLPQTMGTTFDCHSINNNDNNNWAFSTFFVCLQKARKRTPLGPSVCFQPAQRRARSKCFRVAPGGNDGALRRVNQLIRV